MKSLLPMAIALAALGASAPVHAQQPMRSVNVTSDSAPGWIPTEDQEAMARKAALNFLKAKDEGKYAEAFALFAPTMKSYLSLDQFQAAEREGMSKRGRLISNTIVKVTWTKDPENAPFPGVYAAIDIAAKYANADRHCGYIVAYQSPSGGTFMVMREESTFLDNDTAAKINASGQNVEEIWAQISRVCPNYSPAKPAG